MNNVAMDGFLASIIAVESIRGAAAVLHGPGGCRGHSSRLSSMEMLRDFRIREGPFYFTNPRVPCTYVDDEDYVNGADYKVTELMDTIEGEELCVVIPSPGTSLIGDDLHGAIYRSMFKGDGVALEYCHMSEPMYVGYDCALGEVARNVCRRGETVPGTVALMGIPIVLQGWEETEAEFRGYLEAMGLEVVASVGAGCTYSEFKQAADAEFCVSVLPEWCRDTMESYGRFGVRSVVPEVPVGFEATGKWIRQVADATGRDPQPALDMLGKMEERSSRVLRSGMNLGKRAKCAEFSVAVDSTFAIGLTKWLYGYLSMFPVAVEDSESWDEEARADFVGFLEGIRCGDALERDVFTTRADACFTNGYTARILEKRGVCSAGIDVWIPSRHRLEFVGHPILGGKGALRILDDLFEWMRD